MDNEYTSDVFYHFVGHSDPYNDEANYQTLVKVFKSGWISFKPKNPGYSPIEMTFDPEGDIIGENLLVPQVTCFADIPSKSLGIHVSKYGKFGIGIDKRDLISSGARPVIYIPIHEYGVLGHPHNGHQLVRKVQGIAKAYDSLMENELDDQEEVKVKSEPETIEELHVSMESLLHENFLAYLKAFDSTLDSRDPKNYYMEREWRILGDFKLVPKCVRSIFVAEGYKDRLESEFRYVPDRVKIFPI